MPKPNRLNLVVGMKLTRDGELYRIVALTPATALLQPDAGGDLELYTIGTPQFARFEVA